MIIALGILIFLSLLLAVFVAYQGAEMVSLRADLAHLDNVNTKVCREREAARDEAEQLQDDLESAIEAIYLAKAVIQDEAAKAHLDHLIRAFVDRREDEAVSEEIEALTRVDKFRAGQEG